MAQVTTEGALAVTPHDSTMLSTVCTQLFVGGAGTVSLLMQDGTTAAMTAVPVGLHKFGGFQRVNSTGTAASNLVAFY